MIIKNITKSYNIFSIFAVVLVFFSLLSTSVLGLGVSPSSVNLVLGQEYFYLTIHNNEGIDIDVSLMVTGDDFLELEEKSFFLSADDDKKTIRVFVKDKDYRVDKRAAIKLFENRHGDSMINVNIGIESSVSLMVPSDKAVIEASIITSTNNDDGIGYYLVRLNNKGRGATNGEVFFELNDYEETKKFSLRGLSRKDVSFYNDEELGLGSHEVFSKILYNDEELIMTSTIQVGKPFVDIVKLVPTDYYNEVLFLDVLIKSDWPDSITSEITAIAKGEEFVSRTYTLLSDEKEIPVTIKVLENENTILKLKTNNQELESYEILVKDGVVYINDEHYYLEKETQINTSLIITMIILLIVLIIIFIKKIKNKKDKENTKNLLTKKTRNKKQP